MRFGGVFGKESGKNLRKDLGWILNESGKDLERV